MALLDDAADGLKAIGTHREALLDAYINNHGSIPDTEENRAVSRALLKYHLGWRLEADEPVQISNVLIPTLAAVTRNYRMTTADLSVAHIWREIQDAIEGYKEAKQRGAHTDSDTYLGAVYDLGHQLIENLREGVGQFSHHISSGFTYIYDLELRARENRRVIRRARQLNDVLEGFDHGTLQQWAGGDPHLRRLLLRAIPKALESCGKELVHAIARLSEMLHTITRQQHRTRLIDAVAALYQADQGFEPSIESLEVIPPVLNRAVPILTRSLVDTRNPEHEAVLIDVVSSLPELEPLQAEEFSSTAVQDGLAETMEVIEPHPVQKAADLMIELALESETPLSGEQVHKTYPVECDLELWLLTLVNTINALPDAQRKNLTMNFIEKKDRIFPGNRWVLDLTLQRSQRSYHAAP